MVDPGMPTSMAETVVANVLALHRYHDEYARLRAKGIWTELPPVAAADRTVAILGLGVLGKAAAAALQTFGFRLVGWNRSGASVDGVEVVTLDEALASADIVVNLLPLTPQTQDLFCARTFASMRDGAGFVNVARGQHVVDDDLLTALESGRIRHAHLDVFRTEPLPSDHPFWTHPRVTITPHIAAESQPATCLPVIVDNLRRFAAGQPLRNLIDRDRGY
jgi:glyoxylate/hydroxypyruvate reductase A